MDFNRFQFVTHPEYGACLPGPQAVVYVKWFTGASYVGLRSGILTYQLAGEPERTIKPVRCEDVDVYPVEEFR